MNRRNGISSTKKEEGKIWKLFDIKYLWCSRESKKTLNYIISLKFAGRIQKKTKALCKCRWKCEYQMKHPESSRGRGKELNEKRKKFKSSSSSSSSSYSSLLLLSSMREKKRNENKFKIEEKGKWKLAKTKKLNLYASWNQRFIITYKFHLESFSFSISTLYLNSVFCYLLFLLLTSLLSSYSAQFHLNCGV